MKPNLIKKYDFLKSFNITWIRHSWGRKDKIVILDDKSFFFFLRIQAKISLKKKSASYEYIIQMWRHLLHPN